MFRFDLFLLPFPIHAKWRICEQVIKVFARELIIGESVAKADVVPGSIVIDLLDEHVGSSRRKSAFIVVLAINEELCIRVMFAEVILRFG